MHTDARPVYYNAFISTGVSDELAGESLSKTVIQSTTPTAQKKCWEYRLNV